MLYHVSGNSVRFLSRHCRHLRGVCKLKRLMAQLGWLTRALANCLPPLATKQARPYRVGRAGRGVRNVPADPLKPSRTFNGSLVSAFTGTRDLSNPIEPFTLPLTCYIVDGKVRKSCSVLLHVLLAQEALTQLMRNNHHIDRNTDGVVFSLLIPRNSLL